MPEPTDNLKLLNSSIEKTVMMGTAVNSEEPLNVIVSWIKCNSILDCKLCADIV